MDAATNRGAFGTSGALFRDNEVQSTNYELLRKYERIFIHFVISYPFRNFVEKRSSGGTVQPQFEKLELGPKQDISRAFFVSLFIIHYSLFLIQNI